eukprot:2230510-Pleurochrysis_carterae.AAC.1
MNARPLCVMNCAASSSCIPQASAVRVTSTVRTLCSTFALAFAAAEGRLEVPARRPLPTRRTRRCHEMFECSSLAEPCCGSSYLKAHYIDSQQVGGSVECNDLSSLPLLRRLLGFETLSFHLPIPISLFLHLPIPISLFFIFQFRSASFFIFRS